MPATHLRGTLRLRRLRRDRRPRRPQAAARPLPPRPRRPADPPRPASSPPSRAGLDDAGYRDKIRGELRRFVARGRSSTTQTLDRFLARLRLRRASTSPTTTTGPALTARCSADPRRGPGVLPGLRAAAVRPDLRAARRRTAWSPSRRGWCWRSRSATTWPRRARSTTRSARSSTSTRSSASTTTSARRACRTCSSRGSPTRFLEPLWNAELHRPRADHRRRVARRRHAAAATTTTPARCATWCRTTCCSCSAWSRWSRPTYVDRETVRDEKLKVLQALRPMTPQDVDRLHRRAASTAPGLVDGVAGRRLPARTPSTPTAAPRRSSR